MRYINLNSPAVRLEADEEGFNLLFADKDIEITGRFSSDLVVVRGKVDRSVLMNWADQVAESYITETSGTQPVTTLKLKPGTNWFDLDHTLFNTLYLNS